MPLVRKHLIDLSFDIGVLFDPSHLHIPDHLLIVHLLEMNLFKVVVLQVILEFVELVTMISEGLRQLLYLVQMP